MRLSDKYLKKTNPNPFNDSQSRNFSDEKVYSEFYPISIFWDLFNDQNEIILGTRGSGKTYLLKMMRYSMLKQLSDRKAQQIVKEKKYIALYVPMHLEFVSSLLNITQENSEKTVFFQIAFNCLIAKSLLIELCSLISEIEDNSDRFRSEYIIVNSLFKIWFPNDHNVVNSLADLAERINFLFYNLDASKNLDGYPSVFKRSICTPLLSACEIIVRELNIKSDPSWLVCIDEAEYLSETMQICINSFFRSDSGRVSLKVATLPFYHITRKTNVDSVFISEGNDFSYRVIDMKYDSEDFVNVTNKLCSYRMKNRCDNSYIGSTLDDFLGREESSDLIEKYRTEVGEEKATYDAIFDGIINSLSDTRRKGLLNYKNPRKSIYDKYAPIFYTREVCKISKQGHRKVSWYSGASMVRKISQGNPRAFLHIMSDLFEESRKKKLTTKTQHEVVFKYCKDFCDETQSLEQVGPLIFNNLNCISSILHEKVHDSIMIAVGEEFTILFDNDSQFETQKKWIELAIAHSRLSVSNATIRNGLRKESRLCLSHPYAAYFWIPLRADVLTRIKNNNDDKNTYYVKIPVNDNEKQLELFEE